MKTKHFCEDCNTELQLTHVIEISPKITELVPHDSPLSHTLHELYEIIEGDHYDAVTYSHEKVKIKYKCPTCENTYSLSGKKLNSFKVM